MLSVSGSVSMDSHGSSHNLWHLCVCSSSQQMMSKSAAFAKQADFASTTAALSTGLTRRQTATTSVSKMSSSEMKSVSSQQMSMSSSSQFASSSSSSFSSVQKTTSGAQQSITFSEQK